MAIITAAGAGALLGLALLRIPAVFAASIVLAVTAVVLMRLGRWLLLETIAYTFMLLAALQCSYLIGFIFSKFAGREYRHRIFTGLTGLWG